MSRNISSIILLFFTHISFGQGYFKVNNVTVFENGTEKPLAFGGGLNAPHFSEMDLDFDGKKELIAFDKSNHHLTFYKLNQGIPSLFIPKKAVFPKNLQHWVLLRDMNCDGKEDVVCYGGQGSIAVYLNTSNETDGIQFEINPQIITALFDFPGGQFSTNIYVSNGDLPAIADLDNDGDLDILTFAFAGTTVEYYKNLSIEKTGLCGLDYELKNGCWGYFEEAFSSNEIVLGQKTCPNQVNNPEKSAFKHSGSTLTTFDIDGDNQLDLLLGDISFQNIVAVKMGKSSKGGDSAVSQNVSFPGTNKIDIPIFPGVQFIDVSGDGIKDLLAFPNSAFSINNTQGIWYYKNEGTLTNPIFNLVTTSFLQEQMIEIGENAKVTVVDVNGDDLLDLLVSSRGETIGNGTFSSTISYYKNNGSKVLPSFIKETSDLGNINSQGLGAGLHTCAGNLNNNNRLDLLLGNVSGNIHWMEQDQTNSGDFSLNSSFLKDSENKIIDVGDFSSPFLFDLNKDGKLDLIIGERSGNLNYYENIGTNTNPLFKWITENLGKADANAFPGDFGYSEPCFKIINGETFLFLGNRSGKIKKYLVPGPGIDFVLIDQFMGEVYEGERITVDISDLNGDGKEDLILGNYGGGISIYYQSIVNGVNESLAVDEPIIYPNPNNTGWLNIYNPTANSRIEIWSIVGNIVLEQQLTGVNPQVNISFFPAGTYLINVQSTGKVHRSTFQVIK